MSFTTAAKKYAILFHRWLGVSFCVLFAVWFVSGIVMMYSTFPDLRGREALDHAPNLQPAQVRLSLAAAFAKVQPADPPSQITLKSLADRPVYEFVWGRDKLSVYADSGEMVEEIQEPLARAVAAAYTKLPVHDAKFEGLITEVDQWMVQSQVRSQMPLFKYSWPNGEEAYVSSLTGEMVQHTTRGTRIAAYFGAIPHWLYFTPLRKETKTWQRVVIWSSGIGTVMSLLGLLVGLWLYSPSRRYRFPDGPRSVPYTGQKRWHTILGLLFGLTVSTWAFSGLMSMRPVELRTTGPGRQLSAALRGGPLNLEVFERRSLDDVFRLTGPIKEIEFSSFSKEPFFLARKGWNDSLAVPLLGEPFTFFGEQKIADVLTKAAGQIPVREVRRVDEYEAYYVSRHGDAPLPALFFQLANPGETMYYVDLRTARMVSAYSTQSRWERWLYHGLHSLDLPILYKYRPLWDIVVLVLMLGGTALCVTSMVIGWRRLRRKLAF